MATTYVFAGDDKNEFFTAEMKAWQERADTRHDVVILRPTPGQSLQDVAGGIKGPANIVMATHGGEHSDFTWEKGSDHKYNELFKALAATGADIKSITIDGCYGETAQAMLDSVPKGAVLQSRVGAKVEGITSDSEDSLTRKIVSAKEITPMGMILNALNVTNPAEYQMQADLVTQWAKDHPDKAMRMHVEARTVNPNDVLPHTIGVGGNPPTPIDLNDKMAELSAAHLDHAKLGNAIDKTKEYFTPSDTHMSDAQRHSATAKLQLDAQIDAVAHKLEAGADTSKFTLEEKRIGYAITVAELYESGEMDKLIAKGKGAAYVPPAHETVHTQTKALAALPVAAPHDDHPAAALPAKHQDHPQPAPAQGKAQPVAWNGVGDETTAKIQAIAESVFHLVTDKGGADDHQVDGIKGRLTRAAMREMEDRMGLSHNTSNKDLLDKLLHDSDVKAALGTKITGGEQVADLSLNSAPAANPRVNQR